VKRPGVNGGSAGSSLVLDMAASSLTREWKVAPSITALR